MLQCLLHFPSILADVKEDGFGSFNITPKVPLRDGQALALCNEAGEPGDGDGRTVGGGQCDVEEGGRQEEEEYSPPAGSGGENRRSGGCAHCRGRTFVSPHSHPPPPVAKTLDDYYYYYFGTLWGVP